MSIQRPKRISTCNFIGTKPSSQSAIGGDSIRNNSSGRVAIIIGCIEGLLELAEEHRAIELEVKIVAAIERIEIVGAFAREVFAVGRNRLAVAVDNIFVEAAKHIDVS